jgi:hypothetical protein
VELNNTLVLSDANAGLQLGIGPWAMAGHAAMGTKKKGRNLPRRAPARAQEGGDAEVVTGAGASPMGHSRLVVSGIPWDRICSRIHSRIFGPNHFAFPPLCCARRYSANDLWLGTRHSAPTTAICPTSPATQIYALFTTTAASVIATAAALAVPALVTPLRTLDWCLVPSIPHPVGKWPERALAPGGIAG